MDNLQRSVQVLRYYDSVKHETEYTLIFNINGTRRITSFFSTDSDEEIRRKLIELAGCFESKESGLATT